MLYLLVGSAALDFAVFGDLGLLYLSLKVVGFIAMLNENNAIALLDVDETLLIDYQLGDDAAEQQYTENGFQLMTITRDKKVWLNMPLLNALKQRGITNLYFFTSMSSSSVKERSELKRKLEELGFTVSKVVTEMDFAAGIEPNLIAKLYCDVERKRSSDSKATTEQVLDSGEHQKIADLISQRPSIELGLGFNKLLELDDMDDEACLSHLGFTEGSPERQFLIENFKKANSNSEPTSAKLAELAKHTYTDMLNKLYRIKLDKLKYKGPKNLMAVSVLESKDHSAQIIYFDDNIANIEGVRDVAEAFGQLHLAAFHVAKKARPQGTYGQLLDQAGHGYVSIKPGWIVSILLAIGLNSLAGIILSWQTNRQKAKEEGIAPPMFYEVKVILLPGDGSQRVYNVKFEQLNQDGITIDDIKKKLRVGFVANSSISIAFGTLEVKEDGEILPPGSMLTPPFDKYTITVQIQSQTKAVEQSPVPDASVSTGPVITATTAVSPSPQASTTITAASSPQAQTTSELESGQRANDHL